MRAKTKATHEAPEAIRVIPVTPEMAKAWLDTRDERERNLKKPLMSSIIRDMEQNNWFFTGDPIRFNETGQLIDGQHRLTGLVITGKTYHFPVINLPSAARHVIDTGATRSLGDVLQIGGHVDGRVLGGIARRILVHERGIRVSSDGQFKPSMTELVEFIEANPDKLRKAVKVAQRVYRGTGGDRVPIAPSIVGALWYLCAEKDEELADWFFTKLAEPLGVEKDDPVYVVRNKIQAFKNRTGRPLTIDNQFRFIVRAWNYTRAGVKVLKLQEPRGGWTSENTPEIE